MNRSFRRRQNSLEPIEFLESGSRNLPATIERNTDYLDIRKSEVTGDGTFEPHQTLFFFERNFEGGFGRLRLNDFAELVERVVADVHYYLWLRFLRTCERIHVVLRLE